MCIYIKISFRFTLYRVHKENLNVEKVLTASIQYLCLGSMRIKLAFKGPFTGGRGVKEFKKSYVDLDQAVFTKSKVAFFFACSLFNVREVHVKYKNLKASFCSSLY